MKEQAYSVKVVTRDALFGRILNAAGSIWMSQRKLLRATSALHNRAAAYFATDSGIFENQL
jgi:predicted alpha/beta superfamily hydrolase